MHDPLRAIVEAMWREQIEDAKRRAEQRRQQAIQQADCLDELVLIVGVSMFVAALALLALIPKW